MKNSLMIASEVNSCFWPGTVCTIE